MTPLAMIAEWRKGCSNSMGREPEACRQCTRALIDALEKALQPKPKKAKQRRPMYGNYYVIDRGRAYRVCATSSDRVLMVMLKHRHKEQALGQTRRAAEVIRAAEKKYGKVFLKS